MDTGEVTVPPVGRVQSKDKGVDTDTAVAPLLWEFACAAGHESGESGSMVDVSVPQPLTATSASAAATAVTFLPVLPLAVPPRIDRSP